ncbi:unnamed protein product [Kuraishia capsulata CBS 1993]|uniref:NADH:ubiquinone oxidoreductase 30kDa subunit domain-containing protein n=1 Tax=Kuraishia capsulata CBS 1993 TaxID=1382522 RepID=W6MIQ0_9ASCO|nr:uncharacterized protein KUCA_T00001987001 [Kuraishia capsulata CBS 1993]CDK26016.1 unnamed protein product [Kuraishia capsulata CBS 1993]
MLRLAPRSLLRARPLQSAVRGFSVRAAARYEDPLDVRQLPRAETQELNVPIYNPKDKYKVQVEELHKFGRYIMGCLPKYVQKFSVWKDELVIYVGPSAVTPVLTFLKDHTSAQFKSCVDVTAADYPSRTNRFDVVWDLLSVRYNSRIRVKTYASEVSPVPSSVPLYQGANWFERETYDLFGIFFEGHPDLRRIMTDYGFEGHPLRKDFPTTGYTEVRYDAEKRRVVYEPLELTQAWRNFSVGSAVWEQVGPGKDDTPESFKLPVPEPEPEVEEKK